MIIQYIISFAFSQLYLKFIHLRDYCINVRITNSHPQHFGFFLVCVAPLSLILLLNIFSKYRTPK